MLVSGPEIVTRGFIYVKESDDMMDEMRELSFEALEDQIDRGVKDFNKLRSSVRDALSDYVWKKTNRRPMIMAVILEV